MHYDPRSLDSKVPLPHLQQWTGPRPLAWISSVDENGVDDLSTLLHWQWLSDKSPVIMFSVEQGADGKRAPAVVNAETSGWFVWNSATAALQSCVERSRHPTLNSQDGFKQAGVDKAPCIKAPCARVAQSPAHMECRYLSTQRLPSYKQGEFVDLVLAEVVHAHIKDELLEVLEPSVEAANQSLLYLSPGNFTTLNANASNNNRVAV